MLYTLEQVVTGRKPPICIQAQATVLDALHVMIGYHIGQLPVLNTNGDVIGLISQQSILSTYLYAKGKVALLDLPVSHCLDPVITLTTAADLMTAIDLLRTRGRYALVVLQENKPVGILTGKDMSYFFRSLFEGLLLLEQIEVALRNFIQTAYPDEAARQAALVAAFGSSSTEKDKPARGSRYLTFTDQIFLIQDNDNWPTFAESLGPRDFFVPMMEQIRQMRNRMAHFNGKPDSLQMDNLRRMAAWVLARPPLAAPDGQSAAPVSASALPEPAASSRNLDSLLVGRRPLVGIGPEATVGEALRVLLENSFAQLPVLDKEGRLTGVVTQTAILRLYYHTEGAVDLLSLNLAHCLEAAMTVDVNDGLFRAVDVLTMPRVAAVFVLREAKPAGILTGKDMTDYFRALFEGIILVERVEKALNDQISRAFPTEEALNAAAILAYGADRKNPNLPQRHPHWATLADKLVLICDNHNWPFFEPVLGPRDAFMHLMERVRRVRNEIMHFRGDLKALERDALDQACHWLEQRTQTAQPLPATAAPPSQADQGSNPYYGMMQRPLRTSILSSDASTDAAK